jgi:hypothetical protein
MLVFFIKSHYTQKLKFYMLQLSYFVCRKNYDYCHTLGEEQELYEQILLAFSRQWVEKSPVISSKL